jgi:hypothetical protein
MVEVVSMVLPSRARPRDQACWVTGHRTLRRRWHGCGSNFLSGRTGPRRAGARGRGRSQWDPMLPGHDSRSRFSRRMEEFFTRGLVFALVLCAAMALGPPGARIRTRGEHFAVAARVSSARSFRQHGPHAAAGRASRPASHHHLAGGSGRQQRRIIRRDAASHVSQAHARGGHTVGCTHRTFPCGWPSGAACSTCRPRVLSTVRARATTCSPARTRAAPTSLGQVRRASNAAERTACARADPALPPDDVSDVKGARVIELRVRLLSARVCTCVCTPLSHRLTTWRSIQRWIAFFALHRTYRALGVLQGSWFDAHGAPTPMHLEFERVAAEQYSLARSKLIEVAWHLALAHAPSLWWGGNAKNRLAYACARSRFVSRTSPADAAATASGPARRRAFRASNQSATASLP